MDVLHQRLNKRLQTEQTQSDSSSIVSSMTDQSEVAGWIQKAQQEQEQQGYDFSIVNDNLDRAYRELKDYCLSVYWKDFDQED